MEIIFLTGTGTELDSFFKLSGHSIIIKKLPQIIDIYFIGLAVFNQFQKLKWHNIFTNIRNT